MLKQIRIENFKQIKRANIEVAPITLLYGQNNTGKTSILYTPIVLRNIIANPNFYIYDSAKPAKIEITISGDRGRAQYGIVLRRDGCKFWVADPKKETLPLPGIFPYCISELDLVSFISAKRGFTQTSYNNALKEPYATTEETIAASLANDAQLLGEVNTYIKQIFREKLKIQAEKDSFHIGIVNKDSNIIDLKECGAGINQVVFLLTAVLRNKIPIAFIQNPEICLHPSAQVKLVKILTRIVKERGKRMVIETHSDTIVSTFLTLVAQKVLSPKDIRCYLVQKSKGGSIAKEQPVNEKGQIEGGLSSFEDGLKII